MTVKAEELRTLEAEELGSRLKQSRRELYELRFKLAVGQLENNREIRKVRKDIARILTVIHQHRLEDAGAGAEFEAAVVATAAQPVTTEEMAAVDERVEAATLHEHDHSDHDAEDHAGDRPGEHEHDEKETKE
jgi:large subunit ribosomal protein L29